MNSSTIIEAIGYTGSLLVVISMLMTSVKKLRIVNSVGSGIFTAYALMIHSYPTALMNGVLLIINFYYLYKIKKNEKEYTVIECYQDESIVQLYLKQYIDDIHRFFPDFKIEDGHKLTFLICSESRPIGVLIGKINKDFSFNISLDYAHPAYRDNSIGRYIYGYLHDKWDIEKLMLDINTINHEEFMLKMGFVRDGEAYIKNFD